MAARIWLIGGTQESAELAKALVQAQLPCTVTVTTESARSLYPDVPELAVWVGRLCAEQSEMFLQEHLVGGILDASHPFAIEVSQFAMQLSQRGIPYLRYERPELKEPGITLDCIESLLSTDLLWEQRVLLTIGYRSLPLFQPWQNRATLFARILPSPIALETALNAGFTADRLIALRPPISAELERSLWRQWQISMVVTKASGTPGGEDTKQRVAAELGVKVVTIDRPAIDYPRQTSDFAAALAFCRDCLR